jgi:hypothetical protein
MWMGQSEGDTYEDGRESYQELGGGDFGSGGVCGLREQPTGNGNEDGAYPHGTAG